jgi:nucleoside phosphorylase
MFEASIPLRVFFSECLKAAEKAAYEIVLCLVAREGDAPEIYKEITRYWSSLHDLTGEGVLFVFAGPQEGKLAEGGVRHRRDPVYYTANGIAVAPRNKLAFDLWRDLHQGTPTVQRRSRLPERHSLEVSDLKAVFNLREVDLPCLHVTFLRDGTTTVLKLQRDRRLSFYACIKAIMAEAEPHVVELRLLSTHVIETKKTLARLEEAKNEVRWSFEGTVSRIASMAENEMISCEAKEWLTEVIKILRDPLSGVDQRRKYFGLLESLRKDEAFWRKHRSELQRAIDLKTSSLRRLETNAAPVPTHPLSKDELGNSLKEAGRRAQSVFQSLKESVRRADASMSRRAAIDLPDRKADVCILTVIQPELEAAKAALGLTDVHRVKLPDTGSVYWLTKVFSRRTNRDYTVALGCIANAGNYDSAAAASEAVFAFSPRCMLLVGIAAGIKGKVKLGQVVLSERIVAYELASLELNKDGMTTEVRRPEITRVGHSIHQDLVAYQGREACNRVDALCSVIQDAKQADAVDIQSLGLSASDVARWAEITTSTIASGEKLLRSENKLRAIRLNIHGKTEVGEMESAGFVTVCLRSNVDWLVIRGISDFGDSLKSDHFHSLASIRAAASAVDFLSHGLEIIPSK